MSTQREPSSALEDVLHQLERGIHQAGDPDTRVAAVEKVLRQHLEGTSWLPPRCVETTSRGYARHLVHRDAEGRFSVVAMVWAPGQSTPIHDHAGVWCVEGVYAGRIRVTLYDLLGPIDDGVARFRKHDRIEHGLGGTGCLIPPVEHHTIECCGEEPAVTLHVYGAELTHCSIFTPRSDGAYVLDDRALTYTTIPADGASVIDA